MFFDVYFYVLLHYAYFQIKIHNLSRTDLSKSRIKYVDISNCDDVRPQDYKISRDTQFFRSSKTDRGPLDKN